MKQLSEDQVDRLLSSEVAYEILYALENNSGQLYSKELVEITDRSKDSINKYIKLLRDAKLIERGKRTQAQYYKINYSGFYRVYNFLVGLKSKEYSSGDYNTISDFENEGVDEEKIKEFIQSYVRNYISEVEHSTIEDMVSTKLYEGILSQPESECPSWFVGLQHQVKNLKRVYQNPHYLVKDSLEDV